MSINIELMLAGLLGAASSLLVPTGVSLSSRPVRPSSRPRRAPAPSCCICINCKLVDRCKLYHWVEEMHAQPHLTEEADFDPSDPQVRGRGSRDSCEDAEATRCSFWWCGLSRLVALLFSTQVQVFLRNEEEAENVADGRPLLTTEYDVFACDAFTPDKGRWLRLMPDAQYVPT